MNSAGEESTRDSEFFLKPPDSGKDADGPSNNRPVPVLLFHGLTGVPGVMRPLAEHLVSKGHACYAPLLSGHGCSVEELAGISMASWILDAEIALQKVYLESGQPVDICGQSFGSLLALYLAVARPEKVRKVICFAPPIKLRLTKRHVALGAASFLPDSFLKRLGYIEKKRQSHASYIYPHKAYSRHSIAAAARVVKFMRVLKKISFALNKPVMVMFDPEDSLISSRTDKAATQLLPKASLQVLKIHGGCHDLTIGPHCHFLFEKTADFLGC